MLPTHWIPMKTISYALFLAGVCLSLQGCVYLAAPATTAVIGGAGLVIKGAELQGQIRRADAQEAITVSFKNTWDASIAALLNLDIEVTLNKRAAPRNGGLIEGKTKGTDVTHVKVVIIKLTEKISEVGVSATHPGCLWASHDKALAALIADKIREEAQKQRHDECSLGPGGT
jgi:hypothetical protein